jgi:uncharacterized protein YecE (DUF72 family)
LIVAEILVGTSGYSYDDWRGAFYPLQLKRGDMLEYYAREFRYAEVNSTYYALPSQQTMAGLAERTPQEFVFTVKAFKSLTHERQENVEADAGKFRFSLEPLIETGKVGAVLLQFPYSFKCYEENRRYLARLGKLLNGIPLATEFRHSSWEQPAVWAFLRDLGMAYVAVDEPQLRGLVGNSAELTSGIGYVRFHGRNAGNWWQHQQAYERYDYLYQESELQEWVPRIHSLAQGADRLFVTFNNHYKGQAITNARMMQKMLQS